MEEHAHPEIIIIKRRGGHEEEHHGGAWKIAFADFMTAMMAFFLVLWIISATDKNTKTIIARYFNPVKLEETSRTPKSIHGDGTTNACGDRARHHAQPRSEGARSSRDRAAAKRQERCDRRDQRPRQARPEQVRRGRQSGRSRQSEGDHERGRAVQRSL